MSKNVSVEVGRPSSPSQFQVSKTKSSEQTLEKKTSTEGDTVVKKEEETAVRPEKSENEKDIENERSYGPQHAVRVLLPVTVCIVLVVFIVMTVFSSTVINISRSRDTSRWNMMGESKENSASENIWRAVVNGLIMLGCIIVMTCVIVALYYFKLYVIIWAFLGCSIIVGIIVETYLVSQRVFLVYGIPISLPTYVFLSLNWACLVVLSILWKAPLLLQQIGMVYLSCSMSLLLQLLLPPWTGWSVLGLLVIWDLIAVLAPCGPLKKLVEMAQERDERGTGPLSALVYTSSMAFFNDLRDHRIEGGKEEETQLKEDDEEKGEKKNGESEEEDDNGIQLGLGDFVFYSILMGKVAETGYWTTVIACYVAIIGGLVLTLLLLIVRRHALPALPISLTCGIIFYFSGEYSLVPCLAQFQSRQLLY